MGEGIGLEVETGFFVLNVKMFMRLISVSYEFRCSGGFFVEGWVLV